TRQSTHARRICQASCRNPARPVSPPSGRTRRCPFRWRPGRPIPGWRCLRRPAPRTAGAFAERRARRAAVADARGLVLIDVLGAVDILRHEHISAVEEQTTAVGQIARLIGGETFPVLRPRRYAGGDPGAGLEFSSRDELFGTVGFHSCRSGPGWIARRAAELALDRVVEV